MKIWAIAIALAACSVGSQAAASDYGDAPNSYATLLASLGPSHGVIPTLRLGAVVDEEADGVPSPAADGDDLGGVDDEDGVSVPAVVSGTTARFSVRVLNSTGAPARLIGWLDTNGNGVFDGSEAVQIAVVSQASVQSVIVAFNVPSTADIDTGGSTYARFRLTTDAAITTGTPGGAAANGEVEDYVVTISPPGLAVFIDNGAAALVAGQAVQYSADIANSGLAPVTRTVSIPFNPAVFSGVTWTCAAIGTASCITGSPSGTGTVGAGSVTTTSDIGAGGRLIFTIDATLRADFPGPTATVTATLGTGEAASDTDPAAAAVVSVPTMSEWSMILLGLMLAGGAALLIQRRRAEA